MNLDVAVQDLRDQVAALTRRLDRLEGSSFYFHTTQPQSINDVANTATAAEVRAGLQQVVRAMRTFGLGG